MRCSMNRRVWQRLAVLATALALQACTHVEPWARGTLAAREMRVAPSPPLARLRDHMHISKEAAQGGHQGVSGGCGCN